jgi:glycosyltransferase involved in cell wall biosynthesis
MLVLSVIVITKDAEYDIRRCLESIKWADEIIILDSGSVDNTLKICAEYTSSIFSTDWPGFGIQKNRALDKAQGKWVLSLDADEALSSELIQEIKQLIHNPNPHEDAYLIKRISYFCGRKIQHGDWGNDKVIRLFQKKPAIRFTPELVHEKVIGYCRLGHLNHVIFHYTLHNISQMLTKLEDYSTIGAKRAYQQNKHTNFFKAISHSIWCFFRGYFLRLGFLDGREGFLLAFSNATSVFYRYIKLIYLYKSHALQKKP